MLRILLISFLTLVGARVVLQAQPVAEVYWTVQDPEDKTDTIIDFGVTIEGGRLHKYVVIRNLGTQTLALLPSSPLAEPYFQIVSVPEKDPQDAAKDEFKANSGLPFYIPVGQSKTFELEFQAFQNSISFPVDVLAEAWVKFRFVDSTNPSGPSFDKNFRLKALKSSKPLASTSPRVLFDSVYVSQFAYNRNYRVTNVANAMVEVNSQRLTPLTPIIGPQEIIIDTLPVAKFAPLSPVTWPIKYMPNNKGIDSARFELEYKAEASSEYTTVSTVISGFGVEQTIAIENVSAPGLNPQVVGTTIHLGTVSTPQDIPIVVVIRNTGNITIGIENEYLEGNRDTLDVKSYSKLALNGKGLPPNQLDTLELLYKPIDKGFRTFAYVIATDIDKRNIRNVPAAVKNLRLIVDATIRQPSIGNIPSEIVFDTSVYTPQCSSTLTEVFTVQNFGDASLRVESITVEPDTPAFVVVSGGFTLGPGETKPVSVLHKPQSVGTATGVLKVVTNALSQPVEVKLTAVDIAPPTIVLQPPAQIFAKPGTQITVPVRVIANEINKAKSMRLTVSYNPTMLRFRQVISDGTASEGSTFTRTEETFPGELHIDAVAPGNFSSKNILVSIVLDTYLGNAEQTEIVMQPGAQSVGVEGCETAFTISTTNSSFRTDSVCGLRYKANVQEARALSAMAYPNPTNSNTTVELISTAKRVVDVFVVDAYGRIQQSVLALEVPKGMLQMPVDMSGLLPGVYSFVVRGNGADTSTNIVVMP